MAEERTLTLAVDDVRVLQAAASMAVTLYDAVEEDGGVPPDAPLYGKRDRIVALARQLDHEANCPTPQQFDLSSFRKEVEGWRTDAEARKDEDARSGFTEHECVAEGEVLLANRVLSRLPGGPDA